MTRYFHTSVGTIARFKQVQAILAQLQPDAAPQAFIVPGSPQPHNSMIVFPGSFNPPTNAHLALLEQAQQFAQRHPPMHLYAAMSKRTTDKEMVERPLLLDRVVLLSTVLQHHLPQAGIVLFNQGLYVEQAQAVYTCFPAVKQLYFLVGFDKIVQILDPRYYADREKALHELFALAQLLVAPRGDEGADALVELLQRPANQPFAGSITALPLDEAYRKLSSSLIRRYPDGYLADVPEEVRNFIRETHAYDPLVRLPDGSRTQEIDEYGQWVKELEALLKEPSDEM